MNRQDKINLLKEIASGKILIEDLTPTKANNVWFVDAGILTNAKTGEVLTNAEFETRYKNSLTVKFE